MGAERIHIYHGPPIISSHSADHTVPDVQNRTILMSASGASRTATLPASPRTNQLVTVKMTGASGANTVTIGRNSKNIDGAAADQVLYFLNDTLTLQYDGTGWQIVNGLLKPFSGSIYRSAGAGAQNVAVNTQTTIQCQTAEYDNGSWSDVANYRFIVRRAGVYRGIATVMLGGMAAGEHVQPQCGGLSSVGVNNRLFFISSSAQMMAQSVCDGVVAAGTVLTCSVTVAGASGTRATIADATFGPSLKVSEIR